VLRRDEHQHRLADGFRSRIAEQLFRTGIPTADDALQRLADDGVSAAPMNVLLLGICFFNPSAFLPPFGRGMRGAGGVGDDRGHRRESWRDFAGCVNGLIARKSLFHPFRVLATRGPGEEGVQSWQSRQNPLELLEPRFQLLGFRFLPGSNRLLDLLCQLIDLVSQRRFQIITDKRIVSGKNSDAEVRVYYGGTGDHLNFEAV
jgi:hypothetical protein